MSAAKRRPSGPTQSRAQRLAAGRRQVVMWLRPDETAALAHLEAAWALGVRDVIGRALLEAAARCPRPAVLACTRCGGKLGLAGPFRVRTEDGDRHDVCPDPLPAGTPEK